MAKTIARIEITLEHRDGNINNLTGHLIVEGKNCYTVLLAKPDGAVEATTIDSESQIPAAGWMAQRLRHLIDEFDCDGCRIRVVADTANLLPKVTYRCSNPSCRAKLFESWGLTPGIRIVCRKCKTLGIPQSDRSGHG